MPNKKSGISIIETVIALMIIAAIGGALMVLNVQIQSASNSARYRNLAEVQAQKMIEVVRNEKILMGGVAGLVDGCYSQDFTPVNCDCKNGTDVEVGTNKFRACVKIEAGSGGKKVQSFVYWIEKGKERSTNVDTYLYDY